MRTFTIALAAACCCTLGCQSNSGQVLVEQEARMLEDEVYHLEAQLDECCRAKQALEQEVAQLRGGSPVTPTTPSRTPLIELPGRSRSRTEAPKLEPPSIELPESGGAPGVEVTPGTETPPGAEPTPGDQQPAVEGAPTSLSINRRLTGGLDRDNAGGDEGILVMVEPRNDQGQLVKSPGAVSVVVMDPAASGDAARVARWDFQAHEFDDHFKRSTFGTGLQYELSWPGEAPTNRDLVLFVRYIGADGAKVTTEAPLHVRMASDSPRIGERLASAEDDDRPDRPRRSRDDGRDADKTPRKLSRDGRPQWSPNR
jgi:hypothetical protein